MQTALAVTNELIDNEVVVEELSRQIRAQLSDLSHAGGLLFASPDYEWDELLPALSSNLGIEIFGATSESMLSSLGYHDEGAVLLVLSGEDCSFAGEVSDSLQSADDAEARVCATYDRALAKLNGQKPKLALFFATSNGNIALPTETVLQLLQEKTGTGVPIFGGYASDMFTFDNSRVFGHAQAHDAAIALMLIAGNINPLCVVRSVPRKRIAHAKATASDGNVIKTIDDLPASKFLEKCGVDVNNSMALQFAPICLEGADGEAMTCRTVKRCDQATGELEMHGAVPVGSAISLQQVDYKDISEMAEEALQEIRRQIEAHNAGGKYSAILTISCCGRHLVLGPHKDLEGKLIGDIKLNGLNCAGFYSMGEVSPLANDGTDTRFHNLSLVLCAI